MTLQIAIITSHPPPDLGGLMNPSTPLSSFRLQNISRNNTPDNFVLEIKKALMANPVALYLDHFEDHPGTWKALEAVRMSGCKVVYLNNATKN